MAPSNAMKASLQEEAFRKVPAQGSLGSVSEVHGVFSNRDVPSISRGQPSTTAIVCMFLESLGHPWLITEMWTLMFGVGVFVRWSWLLAGALIAEMRGVI